MNILYFVFGNNTDIHLQVIFSILSCLGETSKNDIIHVVTTQPLFYERFKERIHIITISEEKLKEWRGKHDFFWRAKIKAIELISKEYPGQDLLYLDGDTVFLDLDSIREQLQSGNTLMHLNEGHPRNMKTKSLSMWHTVDGKTYDSVTLGKEHDMWNAGVVGIPGRILPKTVSLALHLCDGMLDDGAEPIVVEQYSLSIALHECAKLTEARLWIAHYWGNKDGWLNYIHQFFLESHLKGWSQEQEISELQVRKSTFQIPIHNKVPNMKRRLRLFLDRILPDKQSFL